MKTQHRWTMALCVGFVAGPAQIAAQTPATAEVSIRSGVYTEEQAERGAGLLREICSQCHETEEFTGSFMDSWKGTDVAELYDLVFNTMPEDMPGSLKPQEYADALAYIFKLNGIPAGAAELKPDIALMRSMIIERNRERINR